MPCREGRAPDLNDLGHFGLAEYILMHALTYRTAVVRESACSCRSTRSTWTSFTRTKPFPWVKTMKYLDTPFYHYFIGRDGQSVQTDVMIRRVDQLRLVNQCMVRATRNAARCRTAVPLYDPLTIESSVASVFLDFVSRSGKLREEKGYVGRH